MRQVAHGVVHFKPEALERVRHLMKMQSSAVRTAYQFIRRTEHVGNAVRRHVKTHYMEDLNQRYINDACGIASQMRSVPSVIFGGKRAWRDLQHGNITKEQWQERRDAMLYSRGDKSHRGNPNIRVVGDRIFVNDPSRRGLWIEGSVFIPKKFGFDPSCYDVRLRYKNGKTVVQVSSEVVAAPVVTGPISKGTIGADCNPDGIGLVEVDSNGNLLQHLYEKEQRIRFASKGKRTNDVRLLAARVIALALTADKPLVLEKLRFWKGKQVGQKFNRMRHNYLYRQMLEAIKSRAARMGVEVVEVNPAYTSILGKLKYMDMYSLNNHTAAAHVIARRGMGIKEKQTFADTLRGLGGSRVDLEGDTRNHTLKPKSWSWMQNFLASETSRAHSPATGTSNSAGIGGNLGEVPRGEPGSITGRSRQAALPPASGG